MARVHPCARVLPVFDPTEGSSERALRILVVDDNVDSADSLAMLLSFDGYETRCAYEGRSAVDLATGSFCPHVVLLDIGLPEISGYEVAERLRDQRGDALALIALTGWGQQTDRIRSREVGFDAHMVKPVDYEALRKMLGKLSVGAVP